MQVGKHTFYRPYNRQKPWHTPTDCVSFPFSAISDLYLLSPLFGSQGKKSKLSNPYLRVHLFFFQFSLHPPLTSVFLDLAEDKKKSILSWPRSIFWCVVVGTWNGRVHSFDQYIWTVQGHQDEIDIWKEKCFTLPLRFRRRDRRAELHHARPTFLRYSKYIFNGRKEQRRCGGNVEDGH